MSLRTHQILQVLEDAATSVQIDTFNSRDTNHFYKTSSRGINKIKNPYSFDSGASKLVLIFENSPHVIKIPFRGGHMSDYDEEVEEWDCCYQDFIGANGKYNDWDYCKKEMEIYEDACERGLSEFFAKTSLIGNLSNGLPIYRQERIQWIGPREYDETISIEDVSIYLERRVEEIVKKISDFARFEASDVYSMIKSYGVKKTADFLEYEYNYLSDIHESNYGYNQNDDFKVIDYSGYNERD